MLRIAAVVTPLALVGGCSDARVLGGDGNEVWVKEPVIGSGSPDDVASRHCTRYGKKAVYLRTLNVGNDSGLTPTQVYACR